MFTLRWFAVLVLLFVAASVHAMIVPQTFQAQATEALVLRTLETQWLRDPAGSSQGPPGLEVAMLRCRVEAVLWSDSGRVTGSDITLAIAIDAAAVAKAKARNAAQNFPAPQQLYVEVPDAAHAPPGEVFRAFLKPARPGDLSLPRGHEGVPPTDEVYLPGAWQYSFLDYFVTGDEYRGLTECLGELAGATRQADAAVLLTKTAARAFSSTLEDGKEVELDSGTVLEWLGPADSQENAEHWAWEPDSSTLYRLTSRSLIAGRPTWVVRHCDLVDARSREEAMAFALAEKGASHPPRAFAAERRLWNYHTRMEGIANGESRNRQ